MQPRIDLSVLERVLLSTKKISEAPKNPYVDEPSEECIEWKKQERKNLYKSIETLTGNIFLIQNPDAWLTYVKEGKRYRVRPKPKLVLTYDQAVQEARKTPAPGSGAGNGWADV